MDWWDVMTKEEKKMLKSLQDKEKKEESYKSKKSARGLTDKVFIAVAVFTVAAFIYSALLMWVTKDTSGLAYFIPAVAGFGTIVLTSIVAKNTVEKKYQFGDKGSEVQLNENRYEEEV